MNCYKRRKYQILNYCCFVEYCAQIYEQNFLSSIIRIFYHNDYLNIYPKCHYTPKTCARIRTDCALMTFCSRHLTSQSMVSPTWKVRKCKKHDTPSTKAAQQKCRTFNKSMAAKKSKNISFYNSDSSIDYNIIHQLEDTNFWESCL